MSPKGVPKNKPIKDDLPDNAEVTPFKVGQIFFDIKVVAVNPDACKPIDFVLAKRNTEGGMTLGRDGRYERTPGNGSIVRNFDTTEMLWGNKVRSMTVADFQDFVNKRPRYASLA